MGLGKGVLAFFGLAVAGVLGYGAFYAWVKVEGIMRAHRFPNRVTPGDLGWEYDDFSVEVSGLKIRGWFVPNRSRIACIFAPGYDGNRSAFLEGGFSHTLRAFYERGYCLAFFDPRGLGESEGEVYALGAFEDEDILAVMRYLEAERNVDEFILFGVSAGASAAIRAAASAPKGKICCVIADSPFAVPDWTELYPPFWVKVFKLVARLRFGGRLTSELDLRDDARRVSRIFICVGERDRTTLPLNALRLFQLASPPKELWVVPGADHAQAASLYPEEYDKRVLGFVERCREFGGGRG